MSADHKESSQGDTGRDKIEHASSSSSPLLAVAAPLNPSDVAGHIDGFEWLINVAKSDPGEYNRLYNGLPAEAKSFVRYLRDKAHVVKNPLQDRDPGPVTVVTVSRSKGATEQIILVENLRGTVPSKKSLCTLFNDLEREGFKLVKGGAGGAKFKSNEDSEIVFVFTKGQKGAGK
jgi:hypothetical protein